MRTLRAHRVLARRVFVFIIFAMVHRQPRPNDVGGAPRRPPQTAESGHPTLQVRGTIFWNPMARVALAQVSYVKRPWRSI